jgi:hypothetical protein
VAETKCPFQKIHAKNKKSHAKIAEKKIHAKGKIAMQKLESMQK